MRVAIRRGSTAGAGSLRDREIMIGMQGAEVFAQVRRGACTVQRCRRRCCVAANGTKMAPLILLRLPSAPHGIRWHHAWPAAPEEVSASRCRAAPTLNCGDYRSSGSKSRSGSVLEVLPAAAGVAVVHPRGTRRR